MIKDIQVEIFKTNVNQVVTANRVLEQLHNQFPQAAFNFDLADYDHILRVETHEINTKEIIRIVETLGFLCQLIE